MEVVKPSWLQHAPGRQDALLTRLIVYVVGAGGRKSQQDSSIFSIDHSGQPWTANDGGRLATAGLDCTIRIWSVGSAEDGSSDSRMEVDSEQHEGQAPPVKKLSPATHLVAVMARHTGKDTWSLLSLHLLTLLAPRRRALRSLVPVGGHDSGSQDAPRPQSAVAIPGQQRRRFGHSRLAAHRVGARQMSMLTITV